MTRLPSVLPPNPLTFKWLWMVMWAFKWWAFKWYDFKLFSESSWRRYARHSPVLPSARLRMKVSVVALDTLYAINSTWTSSLL